MEIDSENMIGVLQTFPNQLEEALSLAEKLNITGKFDNVIVAGMGGSGHSGDLLAAYAQHIGLKLPVFVVRDYMLPAFVNNKSLVFLISYSGNTEETLSAFEDALAREAKMVVITAGGKLQRMAEDLRIPLVLVPSGLQPRLSVGYLFVPILMVLARAGIIADPSAQIRQTATFLRSTDVLPAAKEIAQHLKGNVPLIYTSTHYRIAGYIWKILINECSKTHAFNHTLPEMNHNEINAYKNLNAPYFALFLEDESDHQRIRDRVKITKEIIAKSKIESFHILLKGHSFLAKMFKAIHMGMYVSYYLALAYETDPTPVPVIEDLKLMLAAPMPPQPQLQ